MMVGRRWEGRACFARGAPPPPFIFKNIVHHRPAIRPAGALNACWLTVGGRDMHTLHRIPYHLSSAIRYKSRGSNSATPRNQLSYKFRASQPRGLELVYSLKIQCCFWFRKHIGSNSRPYKVGNQTRANDQNPRP